MSDIFKQRYTRAQLGSMCAMKREGSTNQAIADAFGCTKQWVGMVFTFKRRKDDIMMLMAAYERS